MMYRCVPWQTYAGDFAVRAKCEIAVPQCQQRPQMQGLLRQEPDTQVWYSVDYCPQRMGKEADMDVDHQDLAKLLSGIG